MALFGRFRTLVLRFRKDGRGVAAVEFVLVAPILILVMAGSADLGLAVVARMQVNEGVSAAANSAIVSGAGLSSSNADATASTIAAILHRTRGLAEPDATYRISFNGGRTYDFTGGRGTVSGAASTADECRCPTQGNGAIAWGAKADCSTPCANKSLAGRYVSIDVNRPYTPLFAYFGLIGAEGIHVQTLALVN